MDFLWVGNHPGVDLCNTVPVVDGHPVDLLPDAEALQAWAVAAGAARRSTQVVPSAATLAWVRDLRPLMRAALRADPGGATERRPALSAVAAHMERLQGRPSLDADGRFDLRADDPQMQFRLDVAAMAFGALALDPQRVRLCAGANCVLLFYDNSRSGTRRWHDMATCGNRAKAAAHHARRRERSGGE